MSSSLLKNGGRIKGNGDCFCLLLLIVQDLSKILKLEIFSALSIEFNGKVETYRSDPKSVHQ